MDIQTDGDYIKRVVHGPPGDHTLKNFEVKSIPQFFLYLAISKWITFRAHLIAIARHQ